MAIRIAGKQVWQTVGNKTYSGLKMSVRLMCAKSDGAYVFTSLINGAYYSTLGDSGGDIIAILGWFDKQSSSCTPGEAYSTLILVFDKQNVQDLVTDGSTKYAPVYTLSTATMERPIEQHPDFLCKWAYNLYELVTVGSTPSALPAWAATDNNPAGGTRATPVVRANYLWSRTPPSAPDSEHEYIQVQTAVKFGVDSYLVPRPTVTSTIYYRTRSIASSDIVVVGRLKTPGNTFVYPATQSCWLVTDAQISEATDELMAVTATYQYAAEGWDTAIYPLAT